MVVRFFCDDGRFCGDEYKGLGESKGDNHERVHRLSIHENMFMHQTYSLQSLHYLVVALARQGIKNVKSIEIFIPLVTPSWRTPSIYSSRVIRSRNHGA